MSGTAPPAVRGWTRRRLLLAAPLGAAAAAGAGFWTMLSRMNGGGFDPHDVRAPAVGREIPDFALPGLDARGGFDAAALRGAGAPVLVNFFASWCIPCVEEAPVLAALPSTLPLWGIAYKDRDDEAAGFARRSGARFAELAADRSGGVAIDWGVSGVPESFLVLPGGRIGWHLAGALTADALGAGLLPALARAVRR